MRRQSLKQAKGYSIGVPDGAGVRVAAVSVTDFARGVVYAPIAGRR